VRNNWQAVLVAVAFCSGVAVACAIPRGPAATVEKESPMLNVQPVLNDLRSGDASTRGSAYQELTRLHNDVASGIVNLAKSGRFFTGDVDLLVKFYSSDTVPLLIEHVHYFKAGAGDEAHPLTGYPCALGLQRFGQLSTAAILEYLWKTPPEDITEKANELYAWLFILAYGDAIGGIAGGPKEAIAVIERARDRATYGERAKANYQRLLDKVKELTGPVD
jgi:hypothetical protein